MIGICGGSASGKTTVAQKIIEYLDVPWVTLLSMDCFYKILNHKQHLAAGRNEYNFDHPDAFDFELMLDVLKKLKEGRKVEVPVYNFVTHARESTTKTMYGANVIIFEGILTFHSAEVLEMLDMKIFVDTDSDIRLARRLKRLVERNLGESSSSSSSLTLYESVDSEFTKSCNAYLFNSLSQSVSYSLVLSFFFQRHFATRSRSRRRFEAIFHNGEAVVLQLHRTDNGAR